MEFLTLALVNLVPERERETAGLVWAHGKISWEERFFSLLMEGKDSMRCHVKTRKHPKTVFKNKKTKTLEKIH